MVTVRMTRCASSVVKRTFLNIVPHFSHHSPLHTPTFLIPGPLGLGCTVLGWSYFVFRKFSSHCLAKSAGGGLSINRVVCRDGRDHSPASHHRLCGTEPAIKWLGETGYWSSGQRLSDSTPSQGYSTLDESSVPEYLVRPPLSITLPEPLHPLTRSRLPPRQCGGAQQRARPKTLKRRRRRADRPSQPGPSNHTGAQTAKKRKPGSRVTKGFGDDGKTLDDGTPGGPGTGFRKRAQR